MGDPQPQYNPDAAPEQLLRLYVGGDTDAFGALVGMYEDRLYAFIERMIGDAHLAEDVFQQVFIKVAEKAATFDGRASFSTWVFRIARNASVDELRRRRRQPARLGDGESEDGERIPDRTADSPVENAANRELAGRIRAALAELPEWQREAFLLKEEAELSFEEIGVIQGCGKETAKSRFRLAVDKIRGMLGVNA